MPTASEKRRGRLGGRGRTIGVVAVIVLIVLAMSLKGIATFYTDFLWFRSLGLTNVWRGVLAARIVLALIFIALFFVVCWSNLFIADRLAPAMRPPGPEEDLLEPYHDFIGRRAQLVRGLIAGVFAVIAGAGVSGQWNAWILFTHRVDFGIKDPQFNKDIGFYVFTLPFMSFVVNWLFFSMVMIFLITTVEHYLNGGIRLQTAGERVTPQVKAHLSSLLGALALIKAADYWLARYELTTSTRGVVDGATYTDVKVQLPAIQLLVLISLLSFVLLLVNIRRRGWQLPAVTVGLWLLVLIVAGNIYPAFVQRFSVQPAQSSKERVYVDRNITFTRQAYGLDNVEVRPYNYTKDLAASTILNNPTNADAVENARILDPSAVNGAFQREQGKRAYYRFSSSLDVDRYVIDGQVKPVVIGARELNPGEKKGWENSHLAYTHGNGIAMAVATEVTDRGLPSYVVGQVPPQSDLERIDLQVTRPQIYFGEGMTGYAIVHANGRNEVDYTDDSDKEVLYRYEGEGGVQMGSIFRRAAFAIRFGQIDPLISNFVNKDARIFYNRDVLQRVKTIAPFLRFDDDPYPVIYDGRIVYVIDAYTTSSYYPYSQRNEGGTGGLAGGRYNYVRNSVKAVVDAYDGSVSFYVMPIKDPIIEAYRKAFPDLFTSYDLMPQQLKDHLRYPQDLFSLQTTMWSKYHVSDPAALLTASRQWSVAQNAPRVVQATDNTATAAQTATTTRRQEARVSPYYEQIQLPGETESRFVTLRTFVNFNTDDVLKQLTAFMVADSDGAPERYGKLIVYEFSNTLAPGPAAVAGNVNAKREISQLVSLLNQQGSTVEYGDLLLLPIDNSVLYIRPLFVTSRDTSFPAMTGVVASVGDRVEFGGTLREALEKLFGGDFSTLFPTTPAPTTTTPGTGGSTTPSTTTVPPSGSDLARVRELLSQVMQKQADADAALKKSPPDLAAYGQLQADIRKLIEQATAITSGQGGTAGASSATTTTATTTTVLRPASA